MQETIFSSTKSFPQDEHIEKTCKPGKGKKTCRYLTMTSNGWSCAKYNSIKDTIDDRVSKGEMKAVGDNCDGILGQIIENQELLQGKRIEYKERMPSFETSGVLEKVEIKDGELCFIADWEGETEGTISITVDNLDVNVLLDRITFGVLGLDHIAGRTTIFLK
ncbi:hypothetical protein COB64_02490 [Candidatus Wolfebacteria bacterium]|nr:MAG: hypothetical protein COB64_02490 [Candidatus Wolfebacteria bacterium]